jgi:ATP synthase in type III secretion protein N
VGGGVAVATMPALALGSHVEIDGPSRVAGVVCGIDGESVRIALNGPADGVAVGAPVRESFSGGRLALGLCALGRAIDANGKARDGGPPLDGRRIAVDIDMQPERSAVAHPMWTGVKTIDALLTIGRGARVGIFGSPGAGKSTLLETILRGTRADAVVVGLVGERGREAQHWIERCNARTSIVCATSDRSAGERARAAQVTLMQARALADRGLHVLALLDSLARTAAALRELAVGSGESVGRGGYPPSVFATIARLVERAGPFARGSVTLIATVLNDGDDRDPVSEAARSLLDGHIQLSHRLAGTGHFPAIDVTESASRTMGNVIGAAHLQSATAVRRAIALLQRAEDARSLGIEPHDEPTRAAIAAENAIEELLLQGDAPVAPPVTLARLAATADMLQ